jgi:tetratricopeptide (TPR) repeat protein
MHAGQLRDARRCLREVLKVEPTSVDALRGLAELALLEENFDEAYERYSSLVESGDQDAVVYYHTALLCQKRGLTSDAIFLYRQALNVEPDFGEALLNLGHALMSLGKDDEARTCWLRASRVKPELIQMDLSLPTVAAIA